MGQMESQITTFSSWPAISRTWIDIPGIHIMSAAVAPDNGIWALESSMPMEKGLLTPPASP